MDNLNILNSEPICNTSFFNKIRYFIIRKLAGDSVLILNAKITIVHEQVNALSINTLKKGALIRGNEFPIYHTIDGDRLILKIK